MDRKVANNIIVGIFVTLAFIVFLYLVFNMGGGTGVFSSQITFYGKFDQVKGLHAGSEVSLSGLHVGVIKDIKVASESTKELIVQMGVSRKYSSTIRADSVATIRTQGVLGDKYIEISIGSENLPLLKDGDVIKTAELADIFTKGGNMVTDISQYFEKGGDFGGLLRNLNTLSGNLVKLTNEVEHQKGLLHELFYGSSGKSINRSMDHLENILGKIDRGEGTLGSLINDPSIYEDVRALLGGAKRSTILKYFMRQFIESGEKEKEKPKK